MIKRLSTLFIIVLIALTGYSQNPLTIEFTSNDTVQAGQSYDVDVRVQDFEDLLSTQIFFLWDSLVLEIDTIPFITGDLPDFDENAITLPSETSSMTKGQLRLSWFAFDLVPKSLPDDHLLFTMRFNVIGNACDSTDVIIGDIDDAMIEVIDENFENIGATADPFPVLIPGMDCGGGTGNQEGVGLVFPHELAEPGDNICVPMTVLNFDTIETFQGSVMWDPDVVSFTGVQNFGLPGLTQGLFGLGNTDNGVLTFLWFDQTGATPQTLPDGSTIFEVCFDVVGNIGESSVVKAFDGPTSIQASSPAPVGVRETFTVDGSITIAEDPGSLFTLIANDVSGAPGSLVCVPVTTNNFEDIAAIQLEMQWDSTKLRFENVSDLNVDMEIFPNFFNQIATDRIRFSWNSNTTSGINLMDGDTIYSLCFTVLGDCEETAFVNFVDQGGVEIVNGNAMVVPYNLVDGELTIQCDLECVIREMNDPRCNGDSNGFISVDIAGGVAPFTCTWFKNGVELSSVPANGSNCVLAGQSAGFYTLVVTDDNGDSTSCDIELENPSPITIIPTIENPGCPPELGSMSVITLGGTGAVTLTYSPEIADLDAIPLGTYTILAEDENGCTAAEIIEISCALTIEVDIINETACGDCGVVDITCEGGEAPYSTSIDPPILDLDCATAGTYTVTCTDANGISASTTFTVEEDPAPAIVTTNISITDAICNGPDGQVELNLSGGCPDFVCQVRLVNGTYQTVDCDAVLEFGSGEYELLVTDAIGNSATEIFEVELEVNEPLSLNVNGVTEADCEMMGSVDLEISGGCNPVCVIENLNSGAQYNCNDLLPPGDYSVTLSDDSGEQRTANFNIADETNVEPLTAVVSNVQDAPCANEPGMATISYTGGCEPVSCELYFDGSNNPLACDAALLPGEWTVVYTDNSGNSVMESFTIDGPAGIDITVDQNMDGNISVTASGGAGGFSYSWIYPDGTTTSDEEDLSGLTQGGTYTLTVTDMDGCTETLSVMAQIGAIFVELEVVSDFDGFGTPCATNSIPCEGDGIIDGVISGGSPPYTITLDDGANQSIYTSLPITGVCEGIYTIIVEDNDGLEAEIMPQVEVTAPAPLTITEDNVDCANAGSANGSITTIVEGGVGGYVYEWQPGGPNGPDNPNVNVGMYILQVTDDNGCTAEMLFEVEDCDDPGTCYEGISVITPNNDGINDRFVISCVTDNPNRLDVFDRYGRHIFTDNNYRNDWSGIDMDNEEIPEGAYYWVLEVLFANGDSRIIKGTVTVLRN